MMTRLTQVGPREETAPLSHFSSMHLIFFRRPTQMNLEAQQQRDAVSRTQSEFQSELTSTLAALSEQHAEVSSARLRAVQYWFHIISEPGIGERDRASAERG